MISPTQLKEHGFNSLDEFPKVITSPVEMELGLPGDLNKNEGTKKVVVASGLIIPVGLTGQMRGVTIRDDGKMLFISHEDPNNTGSALKAEFIANIPYDVRVQVFEIMRRAICVDSGLQTAWDKVFQIWCERFTSNSDEIKRQLIGQFKKAEEAWFGLAKAFDSLITQLTAQMPNVENISMRVIVQMQAELKKGWQGAEETIDQCMIGVIQKEGIPEYLEKNLFDKLKFMLINPTIPSNSTFEVVYEQRSIPTLKLVICDKIT